MRSKEDLYASIKNASPSRRNRSFLKYGEYFKGYSEYELPRKNGKGSRILRIYTGNYLVARLPTGHWLPRRLLYLGMLLLAGVLLFYSASRINLPASGYWTVAVQGLAGIAGWFCAWLLYGLLAFLLAGERLTAYEDTRRERLLKRCRWTLWALGAYGAGAVLLGISFRQPLATLASLGLLALASALVYGILRLEDGLDYDEVPSSPEIPQGARKLDPLGNRRLEDLEEYPPDE